MEAGRCWKVAPRGEWEEEGLEKKKEREGEMWGTRRGLSRL